MQASHVFMLAGLSKFIADQLKNLSQAKKQVFLERFITFD